MALIVKAEALVLESLNNLSVPIGLLFEHLHVSGFHLLFCLLEGCHLFTGLGELALQVRVFFLDHSVGRLELDLVEARSHCDDFLLLLCQLLEQVSILGQSFLTFVLRVLQSGD